MRMPDASMMDMDTGRFDVYAIGRVVKMQPLPSA